MSATSTLIPVLWALLFVFIDKSDLLVVPLAEVLVRVNPGLEGVEVPDGGAFRVLLAAAPDWATASWPGGTCHVACCDGATCE